MSYAILTCQPAKFVAYLIFKEFLADIKLSEMISALSNFENICAFCLKNWQNTQQLPPNFYLVSKLSQLHKQ